MMADTKPHWAPIQTTLNHRMPIFLLKEYRFLLRMLCSRQPATMDCKLSNSRVRHRTRIIRSRLTILYRFTMCISLSSPKEQVWISKRSLRHLKSRTSSIRRNWWHKTTNSMEVFRSHQPLIKWRRIIDMPTQSITTRMCTLRNMLMTSLMIK